MKALKVWSSPLTKQKQIEEEKINGK